MRNKIINVIFVGLCLSVLDAGATCYYQVEIKGIGPDTQSAKAAADIAANQTCGYDDYTWSERASDYLFEKISETKIKASATFKCCGTW